MPVVPRCWGALPKRIHRRASIWRAAPRRARQVQARLPFAVKRARIECGRQARLHTSALALALSGATRSARTKTLCRAALAVCPAATTTTLHCDIVERRANLAQRLGGRAAEPHAERSGAPSIGGPAGRHARTPRTSLRLDDGKGIAPRTRVRQHCSSKQWRAHVRRPPVRCQPPLAERSAPTREARPIRRHQVLALRARASATWSAAGQLLVRHRAPQPRRS